MKVRWKPKAKVRSREAPDPLAPVWRWLEGYLAAAERNRYRKVINHLSPELQPCTHRHAKRTLQGNFELMLLISWFKDKDGHQAVGRALLAKQVYDVWSSPARYLIEFVDFDCSRTWVLVDELKEIDLADLYGASQFSERSIEQIRIGHPDGSPMRRGEHARLERLVKEDLYFDFEEDELAVEFCRATDGLQVFLVPA